MLNDKTNDKLNDKEKNQVGSVGADSLTVNRKNSIENLDDRELLDVTGGAKYVQIGKGRLKKLIKMDTVKAPRSQEIQTSYPEIDPNDLK